MTYAPKVERIVRIRDKATGMWVNYDLDRYEAIFYVLDENGTAYKIASAKQPDADRAAANGRAGHE